VDDATEAVVDRFCVGTKFVHDPDDPSNWACDAQTRWGVRLVKGDESIHEYIRTPRAGAALRAIVARATAPAIEIEANNVRGEADGTPLFVPMPVGRRRQQRRR
jgi:hypothetical protein